MTATLRDECRRLVAQGQPMATELDPQGAEPKALFAAASLCGVRVLEIGSGDGRLTFRYAEAARFSVGVDTALEEIARAVTARPSGLRGRLGFLAANALTLPCRDGAFGTVLLAWSL